MVVKGATRGCYTIGYDPLETHHKPKPREITFPDNVFLGSPIDFKFCSEHGTNTAVLWVQFQNE